MARRRAAISRRKAALSAGRGAGSHGILGSRVICVEFEFFERLELMVFLVAVLLSLSCITAIAQPVEAGANTRADDDNFLLLREAARQDDADKAKAIASRLPNYEIPSYVD
jgi:hypothetical protein